MNYAKINTTDIANGIGVRVSLFVSGCRRHCPGCHNELAWDFDFGQPFTKTTMKRILSRLGEDFIDGLTILGGEPFEPDNVGTMWEIISEVKRVYPTKTIWVYSGYTYEELHDRYPDDLLSMIDVLVDGAFVEDLKDITLKFRGSSNQRIIDVPATLKAGEVVLWKE
jgi:anaerobic ribonucleoside-triphosphate reductase activating protein